MKIVTPEYYKDFSCIAEACTDTCCAGWDVDVDEKSYSYYKKVKGAFGKRLKQVMVPDEEGGCTFTLNQGRCPFLNDKNLCDLFIELGEDKLCETCAEFPRFITEYGMTREIGIAPSCKTAGELIFNYKDKLTFHTQTNDEMITSFNDIDPELFMQLHSARDMAYNILQDRDRTINERCIILLEYAKKIQKHMDVERDDLIANVVRAFNNSDYRNKVVGKIRLKKSDIAMDRAFVAVPHFFDGFKGMEVINPDWYKYCGIVKKYFDGLTMDEFVRDYEAFDKYYNDRQYEYEQLLVNYVFRYFCDAVNDIDVTLKIKNALVGYIVLKQMDVAAWKHNGGELTKTEQVDMAHLYSRQFEHSYYNYEVYSEYFEKKRCYSNNTLECILSL